MYFATPSTRGWVFLGWVFCCFFGFQPALFFCLKALQTGAGKNQPAFPPPKPGRGCLGALSYQLDFAGVALLQIICINLKRGLPLERASRNRELPFSSSCDRILQNTKNETSIHSLKKKMKSAHICLMVSSRPVYLI